MIIAAKGNDSQVSELKDLLSDHKIEALKINKLDDYEVIFDLDFDDNPEHLPHYAAAKGSVVFVGAVKLQLEEILAEYGASHDSCLVGMNTLPSFINRDLLECCVLSEADKQLAEETIVKMGLNVRFVESRVGMVTPRIVCMIINEAYYTVQEGTAKRGDIDLGMKLGTAYPMGPFEWKDKIGIQSVYETLEAMYDDTKDERYKICPLLKKEYLNSFR